jgi:LysM repeat protein
MGIAHGIRIVKMMAKRMIMRQLLLLLMLFPALRSLAQTEDVVYEYKKGKKYIVHYAEEGNTLWGFHSTYHVPVDDIIAANPGIEKGVNKGQKVLIPVGNAEAGTMDGTFLKEHKVEKGETLYAIAKKQGVTVDQLTKLNPEAAKGISPGQILKIPVKAEQASSQSLPTPPVTAPSNPGKTVETTVTFTDTVISHTVRDDETLYSISKRFMVPVIELQEFNKLKSNKIKPGDVLRIPMKKEKVKQIEIRKVEPVKDTRTVDQDLIYKSKEEYHIGVMLPFNLDASSSGSQSLRNIATEFYMGVALAADSLEELGLKAVVHIYDTPSDSVGVVSLLRKPELKNMDLIIGPLLPQGAEIVSSWCRANQVRMVCPSSCNASVLLNNPYVYAAVPSDITQQRIAARYIAENHAKDQIVLVNTGSRDRTQYDAFRQRFTELAKTKGNIKLIEVKTEDLAGYIRKNGNTVFVVPTDDKGAAVKFMNTLHKSGGKAGNGTITVFGTKDWASFDDIRGIFKNKYNLHWAASSDLNYTLDQTKSLLRKFRARYNADMSKYSAQGFDVTYYFVRTLLMDKEAGQGVINAFDMKQVSPGNGFENDQCFILRNADYELIRVALLHE